MKLDNLLTDEAALTELGLRLARQRIEAGLTQQAFAVAAGLSRSTVDRLERGLSVQLSSWIRALRTLGLLEQLNALIPPIEPGPVELLERGRVRKRVRKPATQKREPGAGKPAGKRWSWGEDQ